MDKRVRLADNGVQWYAEKLLADKDGVRDWKIVKVCYSEEQAKQVWGLK